MIGVDYDLFWTLNPKSLEPFTKAFSLKQKYDDTIAWYSGLYVKMAIASSFNKQAKYPDHPMTVEVPQNREMPQEVIKARFLRQMEAINARKRSEVTKVGNE
jgi:hypothetical protein